MKSVRTIFAVDSHTMGEPLRLIVTIKERGWAVDAAKTDWKSVPQHDRVYRLL
jgi:proline racemase